MPSMEVSGGEQLDEKKDTGGLKTKSVKIVSGLIPKGKDIKTAFSFVRLLLSVNYTKVDTALITVGTIFAIAAGVPEPLLGVVLGQLINELNDVSCSTAEYDPSSVRKKVLYLIYITIFNFASIYIYASCWGLVSERIARRYRKAYFRSVIRQEAAFHDTLPSGQVISRLVSDIEMVQSGTSEKVGIYVATISYFVTAYIVAFIKVPIIAGILIAVIPCFFAMAMIGGHLASKYGTRVGKHVDLATSIASSSLSHLKIVHAFNAHKRLEDLFSSHLIRSRHDAVKKAVVHAGQMDGLNSDVSVGAVYTVIFILIDATFIFSQVSPYMHVFSAATSAAGRLLEVINRDSAIDGTSSSAGSELNVDLGREEITFNDHTAIVGPSGGGKSTIMALLERFYDPLSGSIRIGGYYIQDANVASIRGQMGFVQQESQLLDRSIIENIAYGLVGCTQHEDLAEVILDMTLSTVVMLIQNGCPEEEALRNSDIRVAKIFEVSKAAADRANALSFIEILTFGIANPVGTAGGQLSGGQRQRIALAAALVREPKVLILDEATAALDSTSEQLIQSALLKLAGKTTIVSVAHRLAAIKDADQIAVIQNGRLAEVGSPQALLDSNGAYAAMIKQQQMGSASVSDLKSEVFVGDENLTPTEAKTSPEAISLKEQHEVSVVFEKDNTNLEISESSSTNSEGNEKSKSSSNATAKTCLAFIRPNLLLIVLGLAMSVIIGASYSSNAILFGNTVGGLSTCNGTGHVRDSGNLFGLMFFIVGLVELFANLIGGCAYGWAADQILYRTRVASLRSLLSQTMAWHSSEGRSPGVLVAYITGDASSLSGLTGTTIGLLLATAVNLFAGVIISFVVAWKISIVLLPTIPVLLVAGVMKLRVQSQFAERHKKAFSKATEITIEALGNLRLVAGFSLEKQLYGEFLSSIQKPYQNILKAITWGNFWLAAAFSVSNLISALAYWWGSKQIASGMYSQMQFFIVLPALLFSTQSCGQMLALAPDLSKAGKAASRIVDLVHTNSAKEEFGSVDHSHQPLETLPSSDIEASAHAESSSLSSNQRPVSAELREIVFSYPNSPHISVLHGLNVDFQPGRFHALVGPSGSGKSTIFSIIERFYQPNSGSVIINGQDVTKVLSTSFRDEIAIVPQENFLFEGTLAFNIALGARPGYSPTQAEIEEACKLAQIHDVIAGLPDGYETFCTHDGKQFSGGQRQRLSIARALIRQPGLLLLDESTSALDGESEGKIQEALTSLNGKTTVIAIAHRLKTIYRADRIFLIQSGRCVDRGTHTELISRSDMYRESVLHQSLHA
ncbi:ABC transporter integral membrane type 1 [Penicillium frequentans]|uniref:ABC transporter integral membrane type 1 n=1 Tax=Penicillium frequentans TaxID=3151616 RepID=A0AAD6GH24_9EURO|nr:ABC transporter integral membrane type 1 [Penicillium glabrum]